MKAGRVWTGIALFSIVGYLFYPSFSSAESTEVQLCDHSGADPDRGIPACTRLLDEKSSEVDIPNVFNNRGTGWYRKDLFDNAIADFTEAIQRNPSHVGAYRNRGLSWHRKGDFERAIADFTQVIKLSPTSPPGYTDRGAALLSKGELD